MMQLFDSLMAPLGKEHCMILYYLGVINIVFALIVLISGLVMLFNKKTRLLSFSYMINAFVLGFLYYLYRIQYSICIKAL
jgi:hypothetical protein